MRQRRSLLTVLLTLALASTALAQSGGPRGPFHEYPNIPYDGGFTFVRIKYQTAPQGYWYGGWPAWGHGYPLSEQNLMSIMHEVTYLNPDQMAELMKRDIARWQKSIRDIGLKLDP